MCGAVVFWGYNAGLVSYLTVRDYSLPINNLDELSKTNGYKLIVQKATAHVDYFR